MTLADRIRGRTAPVAIVGMGRVGLPLGIAFARVGHRIMGIDTDPTRRREIELGKMPFHEPGCEQALLEAVEDGTLTVHGDPGEVVPGADIIVLCVPTPLAADLRADYGELRGALDDLAPSLRPGQLLILRSTVSPGTLLKVVLPHIIERIPDVAERLLLAACPERIAEGKAIQELEELPEIVGGKDPESTEAAAALFQTLNPNKKLHLTDPTSAELAKLFTNVYRYVNFALANEFAILSEYYLVDGHQIVNMVNDGYPRANIPLPGPAGGPCLSKDGYFLVEELTLPDFVLLAWKLNDTMPAHAVRRLARRLAAHGMQLHGAEVAVLGQTFKRDSDDIRQSPAMRLTEILRREGAKVRTHDPFVPGSALDDVLSGAVAFVLATNHTAYDAVAPGDIASLMEAPRVAVDCWGVLDRAAFSTSGIDLATLGVGEEL
ncbi:MAG: nucleotide sugar dehydrogenase [Actinomycetota bacterium]|nr:nucleotide sugar dehydrogenase [Actinomycetota bacterium]